MLTQDRDEELLLFLEMRRREKGHRDTLRMGSDHISSTTRMSSQQNPLRRTASENFLYSENDKSDYDWLVSPPVSPSKSLMNNLDAKPMALKSRLRYCRDEDKDNISSKTQTTGIKWSTSRPSTPTRRSTTTATKSTMPTSSSTSSSRSTVLKSRPAKPVSKPALSQGASPILRSRPWEPYEMPGYSLEAPSNLRTTLPDWPQTASSRRTRAFGASSSSRSTSIERDVARRQSCSPSRSRAPVGSVNGVVPSLRGRRAKTSNDDGGLINPVAMGNQMVDRVVNMRKLAPPRLTESGGRGCGGYSTAGKSGFGFGRNLSKSSIDMALRHMDVKRESMTGNFRPSVTKVPATSLYSVRSSRTRRTRPVSSSGSSESSVNVLCLDSGDDNLSAREVILS